MKKHVEENPYQLSLFGDAEPDPPPESVVRPELDIQKSAVVPHVKQDPTSSVIMPDTIAHFRSPEWKFPMVDHVDIIADEDTEAFCYDLAVLEKEPGLYHYPVYRALMAALQTMASHNLKKIRNNSFTIYAGDVLATNTFAVAVGTRSATVVDFLASHLRRLHGHTFLESASSVNFTPVFRYDQGYMIEYADEDLKGTQHVDDGDGYSTGLMFYRRSWAPAALLGETRSRYGKLILPDKASI